MKPFFQKQSIKPKKKSPEEKILVEILRDDYREHIREALKDVDEDEEEFEPTEEDVENCLDEFIVKMYEEGLIQEMLASYLEKKIAKAQQFSQ